MNTYKITSIAALLVSLVMFQSTMPVEYKKTTTTTVVNSASSSSRDGFSWQRLILLGAALGGVYMVGSDITTGSDNIKQVMTEALATIKTLGPLSSISALGLGAAGVYSSFTNTKKYTDLRRFFSGTAQIVTAGLLLPIAYNVPSGIAPKLTLGILISGLVMRAFDNYTKIVYGEK
jgi:hypothetical protein